MIIKGCDLSHKQSIKQLTEFLFLVTIIGLLLELLLEEHIVGFWQLAPIILLIASLILFLSKPVLSIFIYFKFSAVLQLMLISFGLIGIYLHLENNFEFEKELFPSKSIWKLIFSSFKGAIPSLAPGALIVVGVLGRLVIQSTNFKNNES